jgi:hypothetical protein
MCSVETLAGTSAILSDVSLGSHQTFHVNSEMIDGIGHDPFQILFNFLSTDHPTIQRYQVWNGSVEKQITQQIVDLT